jgi:hypothetical protein
MAGGMSNRQGFGTMAERVADSRGGADVPPEPPAIRHCFVTGPHGKVPGLLLEWRQRPDGWHGRVVRPVLEADGWVVVEEWLPAGLLDPAPGG